MATIEQCAELKSACSYILTAEEKKEYYERPGWGEMSFRGIRPHLEMIIWIAQELMPLPEHHLRIIPSSNIKSATGCLREIAANLRDIDNFKISQENALSIQSQYITSFINNAERVIGTIGSWMPLLAMRDQEKEDLSAIKEARDASDKAIDGMLNEAKEYVDKRKGEIDSVLRVVRTESSKVGATQFTKQFVDEADNARIRGICWLVSTGFFVAAAFALSILFMLGLFVGSQTNALEIAYGIGGRLIGITVLFYAAIWSGRIALANMHLTSVNKHRAISLETLQAFQNAVDDAAARDAVVLEAARAVYENVPSGYIGRQTSEHGGGGRILELIRSARSQPSQQE